MRFPRTRRIRRALGTTLAAAIAATSAVTVLAPGVARASDPLTISFRMNQHYGPDRNGDGIPMDPHNSSGTANPASFGGLLSCNRGLITPYKWRIDGGPTLTTPVCQLPLSLSQGQHTARLDVGSATATRTFTVRDKLIVSIGDSVASGEGNPDVPADLNPLNPKPERWQNAKCHRSHIAGPAQAALRLENEELSTSVTFVHVACSGAGLKTGILEPYGGIEPNGTPLPSQIDQVRAIIGNRPIDALMISAGANDAGFGEIVVRCIKQAHCEVSSANAPISTSIGTIANTIDALCGIVSSCSSFADSVRNANNTGNSAARVFAQRDLTTRYADVAAAINRPRAQGGLGTPSSRVFITDYFDPSHDELGRVCDPAVLSLDVGRNLPGVSRAEAAWDATVVIPGLNAGVSAAALSAGWHRVNGIASRFAANGYCADADHRAVRRLDESFFRQLDHRGTLHPNDRGHRIYRDRLEAEMEPIVLT